MTSLSVNLNKIALIRNSREGDNPNLVEHAKVCIEAGANGITVHPRPDQRHIRAQDVFQLAKGLPVEFNIEGNPFAPAMKSDRKEVSDYPGFIAIVQEVKPDQCTLVPDSNEQLTSDHGFDLHKQGEQLAPIVAQLKQLGCRVSLFMDPVPEQIELAKQIGADRIELYTGPYADAMKTGENAEKVFQRFYHAAEFAQEIGIGLNAGHDLNLDNLGKFASVPKLLEVSIGHALIIDALKYGLSHAIRRYQSCLGNQA